VLVVSNGPYKPRPSSITAASVLCPTDADCDAHVVPAARAQVREV
jgi:hypothetical protein